MNYSQYCACGRSLGYSKDDQCSKCRSGTCKECGVKTLKGKGDLCSKCRPYKKQANPELFRREYVPGGTIDFEIG